MIFHFSIAADDPRRTATMLSEVWQGEAFYFPMVGVGSWVVHAGDDRRSTIEIYPRGLALYPREGECEQRSEQSSRHTPFHAAIATPLSVEEVEEIARRYACRTSVCRRGPFGVVELWVDNALMLEVLTPEMQQEYQRSVTPQGWRDMLANAWRMTPTGEPLV